MFNPENFALYNKKRVIVLSTENNNAEILDGSIKTTVPLSELEPYIKIPQGMTLIHRHSQPDTRFSDRNRFHGSTIN